MRMHFLGALELIQVIREENSEKHVYASSWPTLQDLIFLFFFFLVSCIVHSGVRGVLEMIVCRRAPSSLDMSPCRTIWTHRKQNSIIFSKTLGPGAGTCARDLGLGRAGAGGRVRMLVELKLVAVCGVASGIRGCVSTSWIHG